eukprot:s580_g28.t1
MSRKCMKIDGVSEEILQLLRTLSDQGVLQDALRQVAASSGGSSMSDASKRRGDEISENVSEHGEFQLVCDSPKTGGSNSTTQVAADGTVVIRAVFRPSEGPFGLDQKARGFQASDPRVVITVMDDDSTMHPKYFEALTYHFMTAGSNHRYLQTWQAPICHFKNFLRQPVLVRISSLFSTLSELACLANPLDCHVTYSTYSISLALASAVGGWDPDHLAEDWHMFAKCAVKTEGRVRCVPIFLPVLNYTPEEDGYWETLCSRWTQAKRHALGVSEVVYVLSASFLAFLELPSWRRFFKFSWKMSPLLSKFTQTHFVNGMAGVWNVMAQLVIHVYMLGSWCYLQDLGGSRCDNDAQILRNSLLVYVQQRSTAIMAFASIFSGGLGAIYFHMVKDRVEGNVNEHWKTRSLALMWLIIEIEVSLCGILQSFIFGALPLWIACIRIIGSIRFNHVVVGMVGRGPEDDMQSP